MEFQIRLPENFNKKSVKGLLEEDWLVPRKVRHFLRTRGDIKRNGIPLRWQDIIEAHDVITITLLDSDYNYQAILFGNPKLVEILYEDEHLIIVNKPAGMKTHGNHLEEIALQNHVTAYLNAQVFVVHRLDMETSGAVLFAKNPFVLPILNRLLEKKKIKREYLALVNGSFKTATTINRKIGRHRHDRRKRIIDSRGGKIAITHVKPLKVSRGKSLVSCQLETGRTHQIRVHLAAIGFPIIGDPLYHPKPVGRLMLHAQKLTLVHPFTTEVIEVISPSLLDSYKF
ncbi:MAG: RluA family pseudouridine synthase [Streptococcaceae bacterium]|jgi:23S rRNA pseudouridine1911/1915/1917 synthase|nr:RluA family pseudouridine synthase [Streptococcaceae bacterium]